MSDYIVQRKPRNASLRFQSFIHNKEMSKDSKAEKSLLGGNRKRTGGRNCYGRITTRHIGGGVDRKYRIIDFKREEREVAGTVRAIHYDPNRNVPIALVFYPNGRKQYILLPEGIKIGSTVSAGENVEATLGNCLPLKNIPIGFLIHNIEMKPGCGGKIIRTAGGSAQLMAKEGEYAIIKLSSGELRMIHLDCWATVGVLANSGFKNVSIGKAGRNRRKGIRPSVRGMAMNPVDHPRGGGEGRSKSGSKPCSPWGKCSAGTKTRKRDNRFIIKRRK
jgi:large subunit ribosomal protein L2